MKRFLFLPFLLLALLGCHNRSSSTADTQTMRRLDTAAFLASFRHLDFDTLSVVCAGDSLENEHSFFHGVAIDTLASVLFPDTVVNSYGGFFSIQQLYAMGRFDLDETYEGYLYRSPVEGYAHAVNLLIYDKKQKKFQNESLILADDWGDDGEVTDLSSVLRRKNRGMEIDVTENLQGPDPADSTYNTTIRTEIGVVYQLQNGHLSETSRKVLHCDTSLRGLYDTSKVVKNSDTITTTQ